MVTDKMITAVWEVLNKQMHRYKYPYEAATQEAIDAAWTTFVFDDESTWPKPYIRYMVIDKTKGMLSSAMAPAGLWVQANHVLCYANAEDLMPDIEILNVQKKGSQDG